jgi:hypothetical protein
LIPGRRCGKIDDPTETTGETFMKFITPIALLCSLLISPGCEDKHPVNIDTDAVRGVAMEILTGIAEGPDEAKAVRKKYFTDWLKNKNPEQEWASYTNDLRERLGRPIRLEQVRFSSDQEGGGQLIYKAYWEKVEEPGVLTLSVIPNGESWQVTNLDIEVPPSIQADALGERTSGDTDDASTPPTSPTSDQ